MMKRKGKKRNEREREKFFWFTSHIQWLWLCAFVCIFIRYISIQLGDYLCMHCILLQPLETNIVTSICTHKYGLSTNRRKQPFNKNIIALPFNEGFYDLSSASEWVNKIVPLIMLSIMIMWPFLFVIISSPGKLVTNNIYSFNCCAEIHILKSYCSTHTNKHTLTLRVFSCHIFMYLATHVYHNNSKII